MRVEITWYLDRYHGYFTPSSSTNWEVAVVMIVLVIMIVVETSHFLFRSAVRFLFTPNCLNRPFACSMCSNLSSLSQRLLFHFRISFFTCSHPSISNPSVLCFTLQPCVLESCPSLLAFPNLVYRKHNDTYQGFYRQSTRLPPPPARHHSSQTLLAHCRFSLTVALCTLSLTSSLTAKCKSLAPLHRELPRPLLPSMPDAWS